MARSVKEVREEINLKENDLETFVTPFKNEQRSMNEDECTKFDGMEADLIKLRAEEATSSRLERTNVKRSEVFSAPAVHVVDNSAPTSNDTFNAFRYFGSIGTPNKIEDSWKRSADKIGCNPFSKFFNIPLKRADISSDVNAEGKYLMNGSTMLGLEKARKYYGGISSVCRKKYSPTNTPQHYGLVDDTDISSSVSQSAQNTQITPANPGFGQKQWIGYNQKTGMAKVSWDSFRDMSNVDLAAEIDEFLGTRLRRKIADLAVNGAGTTAPDGVLLGSVSAGSRTYTTPKAVWQDLIDLSMSVDAEIRESGNGSVCYAMHDTTYGYLQKLADTTDNPLFLNRLSETGRPVRSFNGFPIVIDNFLPVYTEDTAKKAILFGDFNSVVQNFVGDIQIVRSDEIYADFLASGFFAWVCFGQAMIKPSSNDALAPIKHLAITLNAA